RGLRLHAVLPARDGDRRPLRHARRHRSALITKGASKGPLYPHTLGAPQGTRGAPRNCSASPAILAVGARPAAAAATAAIDPALWSTPATTGALSAGWLLAEAASARASLRATRLVAKPAARRAIAKASARPRTAHTEARATAASASRAESRTAWPAAGCGAITIWTGSAGGTRPARPTSAAGLRLVDADHSAIERCAVE